MIVWLRAAVRTPNRLASRASTRMPNIAGLTGTGTTIDT